ncbi:MAG: hypothetical protein AB8U85_06055, partial [Rickettsia conorii subsp. raoultii]
SFVPMLKAYKFLEMRSIKIKSFKIFMVCIFLELKCHPVAIFYRHCEQSLLRGYPSRHCEKNYAVMRRGNLRSL